jgi:hypothetical protein
MEAIQTSFTSASQFVSLGRPKDAYLSLLAGANACLQKLYAVEQEPGSG